MTGASSGVRKSRTFQDRTIELTVNQEQNFIGNLKVTGTESSFGGIVGLGETTSGGPGAAVGNFLQIAGGSMSGPIAYFPRNVTIDSDDNIDIGFEQGSYSTYIVVTSADPTDDLINIIGAAHDGQDLILQALVGKTITLKTTGNIVPPGGADFVLSPEAMIRGIFDPVQNKWIFYTSAGGGGGEFFGPWTANHDAGDWSLIGLKALAFTDIGGQITVEDAAAGFNFVTTSNRPFRFTPNATDILDISTVGVVFLATGKQLAMNQGQINNISDIFMESAGGDIQLNDGELLQVRHIRLMDTGGISRIIFNPSGAADTGIFTNVSDSDRIDFYTNNENVLAVFYDSAHSRDQVGMVFGGLQTNVFAINTNWELWQPTSAPADAQLDNEDGLIFYDTTVDPAELKIKKKDSGGSVTTVSLEGGGGSQTPWVFDIDADGHNLFDLEYVRFIGSGSAPASTFNRIWATSFGLHLGSAGSTKYISFALGGPIQIQFNEDGEILFVDDDHKIVPQTNSLDFTTKNLSNSIKFITGSSRSNETVKIEDFKTTFFTDETEVAAYDLQLVQNNNTPADFRVICNINFIAENSSSVDTRYGIISCTSNDITNNTEDGLLQFGVVSDGVLNVGLEMQGEDDDEVALRFYGRGTFEGQQNVSGSRSGGAALLSLLQALDRFGLINNLTSS